MDYEKEHLQSEDMLPSLVRNTPLQEEVLMPDIHLFCGIVFICHDFSVSLGGSIFLSNVLHKQIQ